MSFEWLAAVTGLVEVVIGVQHFLITLRPRIISALGKENIQLE